MPIALRFLEWVVILLGAAVIVVQGIIPLLKGTELFPFFNKDRRELDKEFTEVLTEAEQEALRKELEEFKKQMQTAHAGNSNVETETKETEK
jgi:hypothetical protein